jgi:hypothetical protein
MVWNAIVNMRIDYLTNGNVPVSDILLRVTFKKILFYLPPTPIYTKDRYARKLGRTRTKIP